MFYYGVEIRTCFQVKRSSSVLEFHPACVILVRFSWDYIHNFNLPRVERKKCTWGLRWMRGRNDHVWDKKKRESSRWGTWAVNQRTIHSGTHSAVLLFLRLVDWWYRSLMEMRVIFTTPARESVGSVASTDRDANYRHSISSGLLTRAFP